MPGVLLCCSVHRAHRAAPLAGVLLCKLAHQSLKEHPGWGPTLHFSASDICWGSLSIVQLPMLVCGEREVMAMAPPLTHDSAVSPFFHGCLVFLHRHFPPQSPPSPPLHLRFCRKQQPSPWDCFTIPISSSQPLHLPGDLCPCPRYVWLGKDCLILIPFRLPQISCFTLSFKCFSSDSIALM